MDQASIPNDFDPESHSTGYSLQDKSQQPVSAIIKLRQENNKLKKELQESREREKNAQRQLIDRICTENAVENDLRSRIEEMKALLKAYEEDNANKLQLEDQVKTKAVQSQIDNSTYSTLANLTVEAEEIIVDIIDNLILDEEVIMDMSNDRIQKLVRDTENYGKGKDKLMEIKTNLRDELGNASKTYSEGLRKKAESAIKNATETKSRLDETIKLLEAEATERRIKFSQSDYEDHMRNFYEPPTFDSLNKSFNIYDFLSRLDRYLEATNIMQDEHGVVLKSCLQDKALTVVEKAYPNMPNPPFENVKSLLMKHFGNIECIISDLRKKHLAIGKIGNLSGDMNNIYKKSSDHSSLIQKTLSVSSQPPRQVVIPKTYLDTIEEILPATYKDKFSTYEIKNTDATPREKLKKLKELVDEIEAKGLLKKTESAKKTSESILHKGSDTDDDNLDSSEENHEYDSEEQESDLEESDQEEEEEEEEEPDQDISKLSHHYLAYTSVYTGNRVLYD